MIQDVAVENKRANVWTTEIDPQCDARKGMRGVAIPIGDFDHVQVLTQDSGRRYVPVDLKIIL